MFLHISFYINLGEEGDPIKKPIPDSGAPKGPGNDLSDNQEDKCIYNCQENGGCSVRIDSSGLVNGATLGSCFSKRFGGKCSGIPERCEVCLDVCEEKSGEQFSLPATIA